jgi:hypothetical protein
MFQSLIDFTGRIYLFFNILFYGLFTVIYHFRYKYCCKGIKSNNGKHLYDYI